MAEKHPFENLPRWEPIRDAAALSLRAVEGIAITLLGGEPDFLADDADAENLPELLRRVDYTIDFHEVSASLFLEEDDYHEEEGWVFTIYSVDNYRVVAALGRSGGEFLAPWWFISRKG